MGTGPSSGSPSPPRRPGGREGGAAAGRRAKRRPNFMIVPTVDCNATCRYCFSARRPGVMDEATWRQTLRFLETLTTPWPKTAPIRITFHGGEPLLAGLAFFERALADLAEMFSPDRLRLSVQSNLWNLSDAFVALFREHHVTIGTSLDGPADVTDRQRCRGYHARTMAGITKAQDHGLPVGCICTPTPASVDRWREIGEFFAAHNLSVTYHPAVPALGVPAHEFVLPPARYGALLREVLAATVADLRAHPVVLVKHAIDFVCGATPQCHYGPCFGKFLVVAPDGALYPCQRFLGHAEFVMGNIRDVAAAGDGSVWRNPVAGKFQRRQAYLRAHQDESTDLLARFSRGGCAYQAFTANRPDRHDPYWLALRSFFEAIEDRLTTEILATYAEATTFRALLHDYPLLFLAKSEKAPRALANTAKTVVAAVLLAKCPSLPAAARFMDALGLLSNWERGLRNLRVLRAGMREKRMNNLYIHLTWLCNLRCTHCYAPVVPAGTPPAPGNTLALDSPILEALLCDARDLGFSKVVFTGGEPTLYPHFEELVAFLTSLKARLAPLALVLRSNGTRTLPRQLAREILTAFDEVVVSLDGDKEAHESIRGTGTYDRVVATLRGLGRLRRQLASPAALTLTFTSTGTNRGYAAREQVVALARDIDESVSVRFNPVLPLGRARRHSACGRDSLGAREREPGAATRREGPAPRDAPPNAFETLEFLNGDFRPRNSCGLGYNLSVDPTGDVYPCHAYKYPETRLGNVLTSRLRAIARGTAMAALQAYTVDENALCGGCPVKYLCFGGCQAWNESPEHVPLPAPPRFCDGRTSAFYRHFRQQVAAALELLGIDPAPFWRAVSS